MQVLFLFFSIFLLFYFLKTCQSTKTSRFTGICASITAANIKTHPSNSLPDKTSCNTRKPAITETTDSKLINKDATVGFNPFCAITCNVYPTPQDKTPEYNIGFAARRIICQSNCSDSNIPMPLIKPATEILNKIYLD